MPGESRFRNHIRFANEHVIYRRLVIGFANSLILMLNYTLTRLPSNIIMATEDIATIKEHVTATSKLKLTVSTVMGWCADPQKSIISKQGLSTEVIKVESFAIKFGNVY